MEKLYRFSYMYGRNVHLTGWYKGVDVNAALKSLMQQNSRRKKTLYIAFAYEVDKHGNEICNGERYLFYAKASDICNS